jgi:hypothetical protein
MSKAIRLALLSGILFAAGAEAGAAAVKIPQRLKAAEKELLIKIGEGGTEGIRVPDENDAAFITLTKAGWLETNPATREGTSILSRLSESGRAKVETFRTPRDPNAVSTRPAMSPDDFEIETFDVSQVVTAQRAQRTVYPFDKLTSVGLSFFVPAPEGYPADKDFASSKQGTVGAQNRKAKEEFEALPAESKPVGAKPASFKAINDTKNGVRGARIVRMT